MAPPISSSSPFPPWIDLPRDVTANILKRLHCVELLQSVQKVCSTWWNACKNPAMWRVIDLNGVPYEGAEEMCHEAVNRSQGQLIDINMANFATDKLLQQISKQSTQLRCLRIAYCSKISGEGLIEAVKNFPHLEELHLFYMSYSISASDIEIIGLSCPMLRSFAFNDRGYHTPLFRSNEYPLAVGKSMPNLRHLRFFGSTMTNEGLVAILDGCPYLESLDIRQCFGIDLTDQVLKIRSQQIAILQCPLDSTSDYEWDAEIYKNEVNDLYALCLSMSSYDLDSDIFRAVNSIPVDWSNWREDP